MSNFKLTTPVAFIIFNRPDTTERVFAEIAKAKPAKLLVVADGARQNKTGEVGKVAATREIIERVDWDCEVITNYSDVNLGCRVRVSSGIDWIFEQVEEAIILEDDCLPDPSFFQFCQEMLEHYRKDLRIGAISGTNLQLGHKRGEYSYFFSKYMHIWGWATWRDRWLNSYDVELKKWPEVRDHELLQLKFYNQKERSYWYGIFQSTYRGDIDTWDYQWFFANWLESRISVVPNVNLISNLGFGMDATHTLHSSSLYSDMPTSPIKFPLHNPDYFLTNYEADTFNASKIYSTKSLFFRGVNKLARLTLGKDFW